MDLSGASPVVFATTTDNKIVEFVDTGAGATATIIATAGANQAFRGIDFSPVTVPEPQGLLLLGSLVLLAWRFTRRQP